ncbi:MAG TPA: hypothetical protein DCE41_27445 [Cytophagales bacterium]|nr:hypothetical protein [Cytophagales bacterium]
MDRQPRTRNRSWDALQPVLTNRWSSLFSAALEKWKEDQSLVGQGEGNCSAKIDTKSGVEVVGCFHADTGIHAEIDAWLKVGDTSKVKKINISSAPCPRCAVVFECLGLSAKVYHRPSSSRGGPSWGYPEAQRVELLTLLCAGVLSGSEIDKYQDQIYNYFVGLAWKP